MSVSTKAVGKNIITYKSDGLIFNVAVSILFVNVTFTTLPVNPANFTALSFVVGVSSKSLCFLSNFG